MSQTVDRIKALFGFVTERQKAYKLCFGSIAGQLVLHDLIAFCRENETCVVAGDPAKTNVLEGRREVFLRIKEHLNLSAEQLATLYSGHTFIVDEGEHNA